MTTDIRSTETVPATEKSLRRPPALWLLIATLVVQAIGAVGGGVVFLLDIDGGLMGMDTSSLAGTPVDTYLLPGLLLLIPLGLVPLYVAWALVRRPRYQWIAWLEHLTKTEAAWCGAIAVGIGLLVWIVAEYLYIDYHWLQAVFGVTGAVIAGLALLPAVRRFYAIR